MFFLCLILGLACAWDLTTRKIPNLLVAGLMGVGTVYFFCTNSVNGVLKYLITVFLVVFFFSTFFKLGMIGGGDVKLLGVTAGFFAGREMVIYLFLTFVIAAIIGVVKLLVLSLARERVKYFFAYMKKTTDGYRSQGRNYRPELYMSDRREKIKVGVALSLPMALSAVLHLGGVY